MAHHDFSPEQNQLNSSSESSLSQSSESLSLAKAMSFDLPQTTPSLLVSDAVDAHDFASDSETGLSALKRLQDKSKFKKAHFAIRLFQNPWLNLFKD